MSKIGFVVILESSTCEKPNFLSAAGILRLLSPNAAVKLGSIDAITFSPLLIKLLTVLKLVFSTL